EEAQHYIPVSIRNKVVIYTEHTLQQNLATITKSIIEQIPTDSVYISIDKDIMDPKDAVTAWDHGTLRLKQMMHMIKAFCQHEDVYGVDVCGEYPVRPTNDYRKTERDAIQKNDRANEYILECIQTWANLSIAH